MVQLHNFHRVLTTKLHLIQRRMIQLQRLEELPRQPQLTLTVLQNHQNRKNLINRIQINRLRMNSLRTENQELGLKVSTLHKVHVLVTPKLRLEVDLLLNTKSSIQSHTANSETLLLAAPTYHAQLPSQKYLKKRVQEPHVSPSAFNVKTVHHLLNKKRLTLHLLFLSMELSRMLEIQLSFGTIRTLKFLPSNQLTDQRMVKRLSKFGVSTSSILERTLLAPSV